MATQRSQLASEHARRRPAEPLVADAVAGPARSALRAPLFAITSGVLAALTVPPFNLSWLAWVALLPLLSATRDASVGRALGLGLLAGLTMFTGLGYGTVAFDPGLAVLVIGGLTAQLGLVFAGTAWLEPGAAPWLRPLVLPSLWVLGERLSLAANAPWSAALSQTSQLALIQSASVLGALWISFLLVLANRTLAAWLDRRRDADRRVARAGLASIATALVITLGYGWWALATETPPATTVRVAAIQPVIATEEYRYQGMVPEYRRRIADAVDDTTARALAERPDLLVWPEGGNGLFAMRIPAERERLAALARASGTGLLLSLYDLDSDARQFNSVFSLGPDGRLLGRYDKVALTPVGERAFTAGSNWQPLPTAQGLVGALVCFESIFSAPARAMVAGGAELLLITTSDASFRNGSLAALHARSAVLRAVENRRDVVQASNTGPSMLVSANGRIHAETPFFTRAVLSGTVARRRDRSLYARFGDAPLLIGCLAVVALAGVGRGRRRPPSAARTIPSPPPVHRAAAAAAALVAGFLLATASLLTTTHGVARFTDPADALRAFLTRPPVPLSNESVASYRQRQSNLCGPAALAFLAHTLGVEVDQDAVARHVTLTPAGTSLADLAGAARALGFEAWGERQNLAAMQAMPKPVIAHIRDDHYLVVLAADAQAIDTFDPARGYVRFDADQFAAQWRGAVLVVRFAKLNH